MEMGIDVHIYGYKYIYKQYKYNISMYIHIYPQQISKFLKIVFKETIL